MRRILLFLTIALLLPFLALAQPPAFMAGSRTTTVLTNQTCRIDAAGDNVYAFLWIDGRDLSGYASLTPRAKISLYDPTNGKWLIGYAGDVGGGETLGGELVTNGDMEAALVGDRTDVRCTVSQSVVTAHGGANSAKVLSDGAPNNFFYFRVSPLMTTHGLYYHSYWAYNPSVSGVPDLRLSTTGTCVKSGPTISTKDAWFNVELYVYNCGADTMYGVGFITPTIVDPTGLFFYVDDISIQRVIDCPTTALHIFNAPSGGARGWLRKDTGSNLNVTSLKVIIDVP
jgi:hypothetical protein